MRKRLEDVAVSRDGQSAIGDHERFLIVDPHARSVAPELPLLLDTNSEWDQASTKPT